LALRANVEHNRVLHECVVTLSVQTARVPHVPDADRLAVNDLGDAHDGVTRLIARFGYQDHPDVPAAVRLAAVRGFLERDVDPARISYFVSNVVVVRGDHRAMSALRERLYLALARKCGRHGRTLRARQRADGRHGRRDRTLIAIGSSGSSMTSTARPPSRRRYASASRPCAKRRVRSAGNRNSASSTARAGSWSPT
jgi:hypothetical protein